MTLVRTRPMHGGTQWVHRFGNGYGASVIDSGYGADRGLYEVGTLWWVDGGSCLGRLEWPLDGVEWECQPDECIGYLTALEVVVVLAAIAALPAPEPA